MENKASSIVKEYGIVKPSYEECTTKIHELVNSLIKESDIQVHSISSRTKDIDNLYLKSQTPDFASLKSEASRWMLGY